MIWPHVLPVVPVSCGMIIASAVAASASLSHWKVSTISLTFE